jgi:hypothetical protein
MISSKGGGTHLCEMMDVLLLDDERWEFFYKNVHKTIATRVCVCVCVLCTLGISSTLPYKGHDCTYQAFFHDRGVGLWTISLASY